MLGSYVGAAYETHREPAAAQFYVALLAWAGVQPHVSVIGASAEVRYLESGAETLVFVLNHGTFPITPVIALGVQAGNYRGTDVVTQTPVDVLERGDSLHLPLRVAAGDVRVVELSPR